jgi:glycosyltransferase involved in cell wall biosynthesis/drug/metabolite transporter (DMT)-like permease
VAESLRISTIIPTYNRARLLGRAVRSALAQAEPGDEIIVVDDGSTDDTEATMRSFGEPVRYIRTANAGAGAARNRGIQHARNPLVAFLDSDDEWLPGKIALQRRVMTAFSQVLFAFSDFATCSATGVVRRRFLVNWSHDRRSWDDILGPAQPVGVDGPLDQFKAHIGDLSLLELRSAYVFTSTLIVRREMAGAALRFAEDVKTYEDLECFGRLALAGPACYLDVETAIQHGHDGARLTNADAITCMDARLRILPRVWGADATFLSRHGSEYRHVLEIDRLTRIRELLAEGRVREAQHDLRELRHGPVTYRLLARLPGSLVPGMLNLFRPVRARTQALARRLQPPQSAPGNRSLAVEPAVATSSSRDAGAAASPPRGVPLRGIVTMCVAAVLWPIMEALAGVLSRGYSPFQIVWVRYSTHLLLMLALWTPGGPLRLLQTRQPGLQAVRSLTMLGMPACFVFAVARLSVSTTMAVFWVAPLMALLLASLWLRERVGWPCWIGACLGYAGALLILAPAGLRPGAVVFPLGMAACFALYQALTRRLREETTAARLFYTALGVWIPLALAAPWFWRMPTLRDLAVMMVIGVLGFIFLLMLDYALDVTPLSRLAPFALAQPIWSTLTTAALTGQPPGLMAVAGAGLVVVAWLPFLWPLPTRATAGTH